MKKYILLFIIIAASASLYSCRNITVADFTPNDIGNIMSFLFYGEQDEPELQDYDEPETTGEPAAAGQDITTGEIIDEPVPAAQEITDIAVPETTSGPAPVTAENTQANAPSFVPVAEGAVSTEVRTDLMFPDAPEIFGGVMFPENLKMTDTLMQAVKNLEKFSVKDFGGAPFYLAIADEGGSRNAKLFTPELGGGELSDMRSYRTRLIETAANIAVTVVPLEAAGIIAEIERDVNAGNYISDILCVPLEIQSRLAEKGLLANLNKIPFLNLGADYYNRSSIEASTVNNITSSLVSDALFDPSEIYAVFYNKNLIEKYNLENPAKLYEGGAWTYERMLEFNKSLAAAAADVNGDYALGLDKESPDIINGLFIGSGGNYFDMRDAYPALNYNNQAAKNFIGALSEIFGSSLNFLDSDEQARRTLFTQGRLLFSVSKLDIIPGIVAIDFNWGILPVPAVDGGAARSFASKDSLSLSVLKGTPNTEISGFVTEAMSVASQNILQEAYLREQLMYTLRDVESVRVLKDIFNSLTYNQYNMYGTAGGVYGATAGVLKEAANRRGDFDALYEAGRVGVNEFFRNSPAFYRN